MNLLLPSTGRRVSLIKRFRQAAKNLSLDLKIVGIEVYENTPSLHFCDAFEIVPRMDDTSFADSLNQVLEKHEIEFILPGSDLDLKYFLDHPLKKNIKILDSRESMRLFLSKSESSKFFKENGLQVSEIYDYENVLEFPCVLKEDLGYGSVNQFKVNSQSELDTFIDKLDKPFIQKWVTGKEYTIDVFSDKSSKIINILARVRDKVRAGVSDVGHVEMNKKLINLILSINQKFNLQGPWNIQCIESKGEFYFLEINPRFSGGIPLTIEAGLDFCQNLLEWASGQKITKFEIKRPNLTMMKYESEFYLDGSN
ncbi:MAG: hypothetical protein COB02_13200 [Candidatus Cloacimonadota bacterium]|nr:MAG: hypothetical protein COB02_13200 [Candidatus Cloacimonadota bacterium]